jgi:hypothetical protein
VTYPLVVEALAQHLSPETPLKRFARLGPEEVAARSSPEAFWYVTSPERLDALCARALKCGRGIAPNGNDPGVVVARVRY